MIQDISIPKQYIISGTLANRPNGQFTGQIYYSTDTEDAYRWDGSTWVDTTINLDDVHKLIGLNGLNILDLTAEATLTAGVNANFERDVYSDATGYLNTVDAGNTTANFDTNKFKNSYSSVTDTSGDSFSGGTVTARGGYRIQTNEPITITKVTKDASCTATICYIRDDSNTLIEQANFVGNDATFSTNALDDATYYRVDMDKGGADYTRRYDGTPALPNRTNVHYISGIYNGSAAGEGHNIVSITSTKLNGDVIVQTNEQTLSEEPTSFMIVSRETTTGTSSVTYDISFDGGSNYQEGLSSFTEYTVTDTGTGLIIKQNLNGGASNNEASTTDWGVLMW